MFFKRAILQTSSLLYALLMTSLFSSCAVGPTYRKPSVSTPAQYKEGNANSHEASSATNTWWTLFDDPYLDDLERQVTVSNQNIAAAEAAYREAFSAVSVSQAGLLPTVSVNADAQRATAKSTPVVAAPSGISRVFSAGASASWQLDVWGRLRRTIENTRATAQASAADLAAATVSNQSLLATSYLQLREADAELQLLGDTANDYQRAAQITQNRYRLGAAAKSDALQADTQLANAQGEIAALQLQRAQLEHAIASLIGQAASNFSITSNADWNATVPAIPTSLPSELLRERPDIVAAERRMAAASANIGVQKAAYFPSLTLTGAYNFVSQSASNLFSPTYAAWSTAAAATGTLFDAGATSARVRGARAAYDGAVAQYRQTVLDAFRNVEDQLAGAMFIARETDSRQNASFAASEAERLLVNQYTAGRISYTDVVSAQTSALSARRSLAQAQLARQTNAVQLVAALGGGWGGGWGDGRDGGSDRQQLK
jgi:NodT family efflux transporter outer membrane factor (OMF) lipoprotein